MTHQLTEWLWVPKVTGYVNELFDDSVFNCWRFQSSDAYSILFHQTSNLHYRLKEDASILDSLDPKIWWIHIGANDVTGDNCSSDSIVSSILPLIDEITSRRPDARIVVNSIVSMQSAKGAIMDEAHWRNVQQANDYLNCYAQEHQDFEFFDARAIFSTIVIDGIVSTSQMTAWGQAIVDRVLELSP